MERFVYSQLVEWKNGKRRKPLVLCGARQVGKTWLMQNFGKNEYEKVVYLNFDNAPAARNMFAEDYNIQRILTTLQALTGVRVTPGDTLVIFDEIQEAPRGLGALKYFCEDAPQYHVVAAGSLLGLALHEGTSFPVGKVDMVDVYPLSFGEFLLARGHGDMVQNIEQQKWNVVNALQEQLVQELRLYYYVGGMPGVVSAYLQDGDLDEVRRLQSAIIRAYREDASKHAPAKDKVRINMVLDSLPSQLAKENKKFIYGVMKKGARAADYETAIQWLIDCGIVYKVPRCRQASIPLKFYEDLSAFKLYLLDCGLLGCMSRVPASKMIVDNSVLTEFKGAFTEEFVAQQLKPQGFPIYYWNSDTADSEVDFVIQTNDKVVPIEVKAEDNVRSKSLRAFINRYPDLKGLRYSMQGYRDQEWMENRPLATAFSLGE